MCVSVRHAGVRASYSLLGWGVVGGMGPPTVVEAWLYSLVRAPPPVDARPYDVDSQAPLTLKAKRDLLSARGAPDFIHGFRVTWIVRHPALKA